MIRGWEWEPMVRATVGSVLGPWSGSVGWISKLCRANKRNLALWEGCAGGLRGLRKISEPSRVIGAQLMKAREPNIRPELDSFCRSSQARIEPGTSQARAFFTYLITPTLILTCRKLNHRCTIIATTPT